MQLKSVNQIKKYSLWFSVLLILSTIVIGCSNSKPSATDEGNAADKGTQEAAQNGDPKVTIEYWQYEFPAKVKLVDSLIKEFQQQHPNITVEQVNFPYDQYNQKVATLIPAGKGPDLINLYYGWLPKYVQSGYLQPLNESDFPKIEDRFFPFVETAKLDGHYYALPTGVRTLALYYNKDLFKKAGLDPEKPPTTWEELVRDAKALTETDKNGQFVTEGLAWEPGSQLHHWFRDGLLYQAGGADTSDDRRKILWNESPAGLEAFKYLIDFASVHKVGINGFYTDDANAFKTGHAAINVDGSYRLGSIKTDAPNLNFAVAPLPSYKNKSSQASFWANAIPANVEGDKLKAATLFLQFLTSKEVQEQWVEKVGELPAQREVALQDKYVKDPHLGPFISQLNESHAHFFIDETQERTLFVNAVDEVILNKVPVEQAFNDLVGKTQKLYDDYWSKQDKK